MSALTPPPAARRAGYAVAVTVTVLGWFVLTAWPGWRDFGFVTEDFTRVLPLVQVAFLATVLTNLGYTLHDASWLRTLGAVVAGGVGIAALVALWRVFPFTFAGSGWEVAFRLALAFAIVGTLLDMLVQVGSFLRERRLI